MTKPARVPRPISVTTVDAGLRAPVTSVRGEIDMTTDDVVRDEVDAQLAIRPRLLVLDLTDVTFMGSAGVHVVVRSHQRAAGQRTGFAIVAGDGLVRRVLEISGLDDVLDLHRTVPAALRAIG